MAAQSIWELPSQTGGKPRNRHAEWVGGEGRQARVTTCSENCRRPGRQAPPRRLLLLTSNGAEPDWALCAHGSLKQSLKGSRRPMAMIREQSFSASSGGPFSCWLNSFSSRVRPAGETGPLEGSTDHQLPPRGRTGEHSRGAARPVATATRRAASRGRRKLCSRRPGAGSLAFSPSPRERTPPLRALRLLPLQRPLGSHWWPSSSFPRVCLRGQLVTTTWAGNVRG